MEANLLAVADTNIPLVIGIIFAIAWLGLVKPVQGHTAGVWHRVTHSKSVVAAIIAQTCALYVTILLFFAAFLGQDSLANMVKIGFGESELKFALFMCAYDAFASLLRTYLTGRATV